MTKLALAAAFVALVVSLAANTATLIVARDVHNITASTNETVKVQVPGLRRQLRQEQKQNTALMFVLNKQAVPAILEMARLLEEAGVKPPLVLLSPDKPPFKP